jgi:hypothetical protein
MRLLPRMAEKRKLVPPASSVITMRESWSYPALLEIIVILFVILKI